MKIIKIITHPLALIISFLLVIISGEHLGGFYLLYILLALPHGGIHSVLAVVGIIILLFNHYSLRDRLNLYTGIVLNFVGSLLLFLSLYYFFINDRHHYNYGTFYQTVPLITIVLFVLLLVSFCGANLYRLLHSSATQQGR